MQKTLLTTALMMSTLYSSEVTVLPYLGGVYYDHSEKKSLKSSDAYLGLYAGFTEDENIVEFTYKYNKTKYKESSNLHNFTQHDFTLKYTLEKPYALFQTGIHGIINQEEVAYRDLGSGYIGFATLAKKSTLYDDRITYGLKMYISLYPQAHSDRSRAVTKTILVGQLSPYISYSSLLGEHLRNDFSFKFHFIYAPYYLQDKYYSYDVSDTIVFEKSYLTLAYLGGEMRSGVLNGGFRVVNNKDLYGGRYSVTVGYFEKAYLAYDVSYVLSSYKEFNPYTLELLPQGVSSTFVASMSYKF